MDQNLTSSPAIGNTMLAEGLQELLNFLNNHGVEAELIDFDEHGFSRTIAFTVYNVDYRIIWFKNESTLHIGANKRSACIPFKYLFYDTTYPLIGGNKSIGFSYVKFEKKSIFDREYPYEVFRLPVEMPEIAFR